MNKCAGGFELPKRGPCPECGAGPSDGCYRANAKIFQEHAALVERVAKLGKCHIKMNGEEHMTQPIESGHLAGDKSEPTAQAQKHSDVLLDILLLKAKTMSESPAVDLPVFGTKALHRARKAGRCEYGRRESNGPVCREEIKAGDWYCDGELNPDKAGGFALQRWCMGCIEHLIEAQK